MGAKDLFSRLDDRVLDTQRVCEMTSKQPFDHQEEPSNGQETRYIDPSALVDPKQRRELESISFMTRLCSKRIHQSSVSTKSFRRLVRENGPSLSSSASHDATGRCAEDPSQEVLR